eukprot:scaffold7688_cov130-Isochrysis_galbana.AAC.3
MPPKGVWEGPHVILHFHFVNNDDVGKTLAHQGRLSPLATLGEEAELLFSDALHNHLIEYDLTQYTAKRTQQKPTTQSDRIRQRHTEWVPEAGWRDQPKYDTDANAPWGHSGNLKKGTSPEGKGR